MRDASKCYDTQEAQLKSKLEEWHLTDQFNVVGFHRVRRPMGNPTLS